MAAFNIDKNDLTGLGGKVVVITGGSSGMGLDAVRMLLDLGASVVAGDLNPMPITHDALAFQETNVGSWTDLQALFNKAIDLHGRIDHVFANAGISGPLTTYLEDIRDEKTGELLAPPTTTLDINLQAVIHTAYLGMYHMRHQPEPKGGSIVCTSSATCFQPFRWVDYCISKHGVLAFMRGVVANIQTEGLPIRVNCIAPSWTRTALLNEETFQEVGHAGLMQPGEVPARSALLLMADETRQGQLIYSAEGRFYEIEKTRLLPMAEEIIGRGPMMEDAIIKDVMEYTTRKAEQEKTQGEKAGEMEGGKDVGEKNV